MNSKCKLIGITGGIGSGKSYVCNIFNKMYGINIFQTDIEVHKQVLQQEQVRRNVIAKFGEDSYTVDGKFNKEKFKNLIINDTHLRMCETHFRDRGDNLKKIPTPLDLLNEITCPVLKDVIKQWGENQTGKYALVECAIIYEAGLEDIFDEIIVVLCPIGLRQERLNKRGMTKDIVDCLIFNQLSDKEKMDKANHVLINNSEIDEQIGMLDKKLRE